MDTVQNGQSPNLRSSDAHGLSSFLSYQQMGPGQALNLLTPVKPPTWSVTTGQIARLWEVPRDTLSPGHNQIINKYSEHQLCITE